VDYSVDGAYLLSSSDDKSSKLWRISDKKFLFGLTGHSHWVRSGVISPDMRIIATGSEDKSSKLWDLHSQTLLNTFA
jgi:WD40 repeat protein